MEAAGQEKDGQALKRRLIVADPDPLVAGEAGMVAGPACEVLVALTDEAILKAVACDASCLVILGPAARADGGTSLMAALRKNSRGRAMEILAITARNRQEPGSALDGGADDFIYRPLSEDELSLRVKAALIRMEAKERLIGECEYFKQAVRQEERLSFKLLDRTVSLRESLADLGQARQALSLASGGPEGPRDPLTGLLSEETLLECLRGQTMAARKDGQSLSCILIGVDMGAEHRDEPGSNAESLKALGSILESILRATDRVGRFGKIGFLVLLGGAELSFAMVIAQRIRDGVRASMPPLGSDSSLSICQGVSQFRLGEEASDWMRRTGTALKRARELGRDAIASA